MRYLSEEKRLCGEESSSVNIFWHRKGIQICSSGPKSQAWGEMNGTETREGRIVGTLERPTVPTRSNDGLYREREVGQNERQL